MDEEMLRRILKEELRIELEPIKKDISEIKNMLIDLETKNADRHTETNLRLEELKDLKKVIKENCYDIAKLKAVI